MHPESAVIRCVSVRTLNGLVARIEKAKFLHEEGRSKLFAFWNLLRLEL